MFWIGPTQPGSCLMVVLGRALPNRGMAWPCPWNFTGRHRTAHAWLAHDKNMPSWAPLFIYYIYFLWLLDKNGYFSSICIFNSTWNCVDETQIHQRGSILNYWVACWDLGSCEGEGEGEGVSTHQSRRTTFSGLSLWQNLSPCTQLLGLPSFHSNLQQLFKNTICDASLLQVNRYLIKV